MNQAGIFEPAEPAPSLDEIARVHSCPSFEEYRRNRLIMGYFRYGSLQSQIGRAKYDNVSSIEKRLSIYKSDHNREHLVDIVLAMIEFTTHPDCPFNHPMTAFTPRKKNEAAIPFQSACKPAQKLLFSARPITAMLSAEGSSGRESKLRQDKTCSKSRFT